MERLFISHDKQILLGVISQGGPHPCTFQKKPSSPFQFGQDENMHVHSIEMRA